VLVTFVVEEMERLNVVPPASESILLVSRLHSAVDVLSQSTVETFVTLYTQTIAEQNDRLEQFTRMAAHEWRQPLGALQVGVSLMRRDNMDAQRADRTLALLERNVQHLVELTHKLEAVARMHGTIDTAVVQEVAAGTVAHEAARQLREMADARGVEIRVAESLPMLTVDVGRLELVFVNLVSNAIKYSDPRKAQRHVHITGAIDGDGWCRLEVADNGVGIPQDALATIFQRFTRAHTGQDEYRHVDGVGLGLSIVEDCVRAIGGRVEVRSIEREGTTFVVSLPRTPAAP
jgi:signal transduction histidine kinase